MEVFFILFPKFGTIGNDEGAQCVKLQDIVSMTDHVFLQSEIEKCILQLSPDLSVQTLQKKVKSVNLLLKAPLYLASSQDRTLVIEMFASFARKIIPYRKITFSLWNDSAETLELLFNHGFTSQQVSLLKARVPFSHWGAEFAKPLLIKKSSVSNHSIFQTLGIEEAAVIPATWQGKVQAIWQLFATRPNTFTMEDLQLFWTLTMQCEIIFQHLSKREQIQKQAIIDALTGLYNRRYFDRQLKVEIDRAHRQKSTLSLLMIDIDNFKKFNDLYSHQAGDNALREMGRLLPENARTVDTVCRYGGEEFTIILPNTDHIKAFLIGERLRKAMEEHPFSINHSKTVNMTLSLGIASYPEVANSDNDLVRKADMAMYEAKRLGKNKVVLYSPQLEGAKEQEELDKGINLNSIDFFMEAMRSLADARKLMHSLLNILLPNLNTEQSLYMEIDRETQQITLLTNQPTNHSHADDCCLHLPLSPKLQESLSHLQTRGYLSTEIKQQLMVSIPNGPTYPWNHVYCHPCQCDHASNAFLLLFLGGEYTLLREGSTQLSKHLDEAVELISQGLKVQQQQRSFYRLAARKLITLSETHLPYYQHHSNRVSSLLAGFTKQLELASDVTRTLADTAYFYDLGLMSISNDILLKNTPLTYSEREICQRHPLISWEIARFSPKSIELDKSAILHHHEAYDGSGYPHQLSGSSIPITARILALVDSYTAMTSPRPYRKAKNSEQAIKEISTLAGIRFDPILTDEFCRFVKNGVAA